MQTVTQHFTVCPTTAREVRDALNALVRIKATETRTRRWLLFRDVTFTVTGPAEAVQKAADEIKEIEDYFSAETRGW